MLRFSFPCQVIYRHPESKRLYIFESEASCTFDEEANPENGVLLAPLSWLYSEAYGRDPEAIILVRKLNFEPTPEDLARVDAFVKRTIGTPYDHVQGIAAVSDNACVTVCCCTPSDHDKSEMFCSESVACLLQEFGVLSKDFPASSYSPGDLAENTGCWLCLGCPCQRLHMATGAVYDKNIVLMNPSVTPEGFDEYWSEANAAQELELTRTDVAWLSAQVTEESIQAGLIPTSNVEPLLLQPLLEHEHRSFRNVE